MFFICKDRCMCTAPVASSSGATADPTVLYCFGEVTWKLTTRIHSVPLKLKSSPVPSSILNLISFNGKSYFNYKT